MLKSEDKNRIAALIAAFRLFVYGLLAQTEEKAKDISTLADSKRRAGDWAGLQDLGIQLASALTKISKIMGAIRRMDLQTEAIDAARQAFEKTGNYCLTLKIARTILDMGEPSKMPCLAYGLPAAACQVGAILRKKAGSICSLCYACKGNYNYIEVMACNYRRLAAIMDLDLWIEAFSMVLQAYLDGKIKGKGKHNDPRYFRFHDTGDLQSAQHLEAIVEIAKRFPQVSFWVPTKERKIVSNYLKSFGNFPSNLVVRVSMPMIGQDPSDFHGLPIACVDSSKAKPCRMINGECGSCRDCWDPKVRAVSYGKH